MITIITERIVIEDPVVFWQPTSYFIHSENSSPCIYSTFGYSADPVLYRLWVA
jgi:hypothetical protein